MTSHQYQLKGVSVVDYAVVPHDYLHKCSDFCVKRAHDLFNQTDLLGRCDPDRNLTVIYACMEVQI